MKKQCSTFVLDERSGMSTFETYRKFYYDPTKLGLENKRMNHWRSGIKSTCPEEAIGAKLSQALYMQPMKGTFHTLSN